MVDRVDGRLSTNQSLCHSQLTQCISDVVKYVRINQSINQSINCVKLIDSAVQKNDLNKCEQVYKLIN